jgi:hypothetical protein
MNRFMGHERSFILYIHKHELLQYDSYDRNRHVNYVHDTKSHWYLEP